MIRRSRLLSIMLSAVLAFGTMSQVPFAVNALEATDKPTLSENTDHGEAVESGKCGDNASFTLYDDGTLIISGSGEITTIYKPNIQYSIKNIIIEEGITSIGENAFISCENLVTVSIPESVKRIEAHAFYGCTSLLGVNIPENIEYITKLAFLQTPWLMFMNAQDDFVIFNGILIDSRIDECEVVVPDGVREIAEYTFSHKENIYSVVLPDTLTKIGANAFTYAPIRSINIPDSVNEIGEGAFRCTELRSVTVPAGVTDIEKSAFAGCKYLTEVKLSEGLKTIKEEAFAYCTRLKHITLPDSVERITRRAFCSCDSLESIDFSEGLYNIDNDAFDDTPLLYDRLDKSPIVTVNGTIITGSYCYGDVTLPDDTKAIGYRAFSENNDIETVTIPKGVRAIGGWSFSMCENLRFVTIEDGVKFIDNHAFWGCEKLEGVIIPESVKIIGRDILDCPVNKIYGVSGSYAEEYAKENHITFVAVNNPSAPSVYSSGKLNDSVTYTQYLDGRLVLGGSGTVTNLSDIDEIDKSKIKIIIIEEGITAIADNALEGLDTLENIKLTKGLKTIGSKAFFDCEKLKSISLPDGFESIGAEAFAGCKALGAVYIPQSTVQIDNSSFSGNTEVVLWGFSDSYAEKYAKSVDVNLAFIAMNKQVDANIADYYTNMFTSNCYLLFDDGTLILYESVIGRYVYNRDDRYYTTANTPWNPKAVKNIKILDRTTVIGDEAFRGHTYLESVELSDRIKEIESFAFTECVNLREINLPEGLTKIGAYAFAVCTSLEKVEIPDSVESIDKDAFLQCDKITLVGSRDSIAQKYAFDNNLYFETFDGPLTDILGDVDLDGKLTVNDVSLIQRLIADILIPNKVQLHVIDADGNGKADISDATYVQRKLAELE